MLDSVRDLSVAELAGRPSPALRSCVRLLGMAVLADREVLRFLDVVDFPDLPAGFEARFARWGTGGNGETPWYDTLLPEIFASTECPRSSNRVARWHKIRRAGLAAGPPGCGRPV